MVSWDMVTKCRTAKLVLDICWLSVLVSGVNNPLIHKEYIIYIQGNLSASVFRLEKNMFLLFKISISEFDFYNNWNYYQSSSVLFSCSVVSDSLRPHGLQHPRPNSPSQTPGVYSNSCPWSQWCHPAISSTVVLFSSYLHSFPTSGSFKWVSSLHQVAEVLEFQLQHQSFQWICRTDFLWDGLVVSPCCPRDSQESSPTN